MTTTVGFLCGSGLLMSVLGGLTIEGENNGTLLWEDANQLVNVIYPSTVGGLSRPATPVYSRLL